MDDKKLEELLEGVASAGYLHGQGKVQSFVIGEAKSRLRAFFYAQESKDDYLPFDEPLRAFGEDEDYD